MAKKINNLDSRWASILQDKIGKIDRLLEEVDRMMKAHAKVEPVKVNIRHIKSARQSVGSLMAFAQLAKGVIRNTDEVRA